MIWRFLEAFFRHKLLIVLPPILITAAVGVYALVSAPVYYEAWTGIWVDRPTYLSYNEGGWNAYISPAQNQANRLTEALRTRSFLVDIANRTVLAPLVGTPRGEDRISTLYSNGFSMAPTGEHLLVLHFRADTARLAYDLLNATIDAFKERAATDRVNQASLAISFYESRLQTAQEDLTKQSSALRQYVAANPRLGSLASSSSGPPDAMLPTSVSDPQLSNMLAQVQYAQKDVERLRSAVEQARFDASAGLEGQELGFQIIDPPTLPTGPTRALRKQLTLPLAGFLGGLVLSGLILALLVAGDRSVRFEMDVPSTARVLGAVPGLKLKLRRLPKAARRDAMRRAIGFAAGTALPAPKGAK